MNLVGLMPCRNEDWILGLSARVALMWVDTLIIYVHASTDRSWEIACGLVDEYRGRVCIMRDDEMIWHEMQQRQRLLQKAREIKATHIAIVDADEVLTGNLLSDTFFRNSMNADELLKLSPPHSPRGENRNSPPGEKLESMNEILMLPGYNLRGSIDRYHSSGLWANRWFSVRFKDDPILNWGGDRFHHREPMGLTLEPYKPVAQHQGGIMHLWGASWRRLRAKSAHYKLIERLRWPDKPVREIDTMYSWAIHGRPQSDDVPAKWQYRDVPASWWEPYAHLMPHLNLDAEPWQEAEIRRIVAKNPGIEAGLDLFGTI